MVQPEKVIDGDQYTFAELDACYRPLLKQFIARLVRGNCWTDDLLQDVLLRVWTKREELRSVRRVRPWLYAIARNITLDHHQRHEVRRRHTKLVVDQQRGFADDTRLIELRYHLNRAVARLPARQRMIYQLIRGHGWTREEVALFLQISPHTVKEHLSRATMTVRAALSGDEP